MNDDRVFQLLRETNPVPDPDGLDSPIALAQVERWTPTMTTGERIPTHASTTKPAPGPNRWKRHAAGAVATLLVLIAGAGMWTIFGGDNNDVLAPTVSVPSSPYPVPDGVTRVIDSQVGVVGILELEYPGSEAEAIAGFYEEWTSNEGGWTAAAPGEGFGADQIAGFVAANGDTITVLRETPDSETILLLSWSNEPDVTPPSTP
ncbi:MAG: hypothetical protein ACR2OI_03510 [Acidimicrobiia bacterium]